MSDPSAHLAHGLDHRLVTTLLAGEVGTFDWDVVGDRLYGDPSFAEMFSVALDADGAAPLDAFIASMHPDDRERVAARIAHSAATGADYDCEYRIVRAGVSRWMTARGRMVLDRDGRVVRFPGVILDIDALKTAEIERERLLREVDAERRRLADVFHTAPSFMCVLHGPAHVFERANDRYMQLVGRDRDIVGKSVLEALPEVESQGFIALLDRVYRTGEPFVGTEYRVGLRRWVDGPIDEHYVDFVYQPLRDAEGAIVGILVQGIDVTDRKRAEDALRTSEENRRLALDAAEMGAWNVDAAASRLTVDARFLVIFGSPGGELTYEEAFARVHPDEREMVAARAAAAMNPADPVPFSAEYRVVHPDGSVRWVHGKGQARVVSEGAARRVVSFNGTVADITERKRTEDSVRQSEEQHRVVLEALDEGVLVNDAAGVIVMANASAARILGLTLDQLKGRDLHDPRWRSVTEDGQTFPGELHPPSVAIRQGRAVQNMVFGAYRGDGSLVWVSINSIPLRDADGRVTGAVTSFHDITERKRAEQAVRESEERFRLLAEALPQMVWTAHADGSVDYFNRKWYQYTGNTKGTEGDASWVPAFDAETGERVHEAWYRAVRTGEPYELEYLLRRAADGMDRWHLARALPLRDASGRVVRWFGAITDIHDMKEAQARIEELLGSERAAREEADRVNRMKDDFLATLSHEIRTPLNAILGWSQILLKSNDPRDMRRGLEVIERNARAQAQIIEDLLDMSRIISGKVRLDVQRLDLATIVETAVATARPTAEAKGVQLQSIIDPLREVVVSGDANRLQQVLWNLISNAIKFTPGGGQVQVLLERVNSHLELSVIDTGEGIGPEFLPFVFDRFRQADGSTTRKHGGLGLGLSIVKQLAELHGGSVLVKSPGLGHGATFVVSLPITAVHPPIESGAARQHPRVQPGSPGIAGPHGDIAGVKVLVVDDEPDARALVKRLLEDHDAVVETAATAAEAVSRIRASSFDVLISDIGMPGEDGYALIKRVRALGRAEGGDIPAIALTAYARPEDRLRAVAAGFLMHITKPVDPVDLVTMVASAAGRTGR